jgi:hypothetical protein
MSVSCGWSAGALGASHAAAVLDVDPPRLRSARRSILACASASCASQRRHDATTSWYHADRGVSC